MLRSWRLGTAFGIGIYVHWTLVLMVACLALINLWEIGPDGAVYVATFFMGVFGCVALHELGHALMARYYGIPTRDITLYPIGGVARLERMSERPSEEFWIAVAGPAVNVAIALGLAGFLTSLGGSLVGGGSVPGNSVLRDLFWVNVILVGFNLLPAFPMDGGRVFRAFLSAFMGHLRATEVAASVGAVVAVLMGTVGALWFKNPMLILVAAFVFFVGRQELAAVRHRASRRWDGPLDVLPADADDIPRVLPVEPVPFSGMVWDDRARAWVVWRNGRPVHTYSAE